ncbi:MAG: DUF6174 domain-containing protein, partial [Bacteroidota bacterium]
ERNRASDRRTIEDYFDLVEDIIDEAERWSVTYDPRFGFPAKISADYDLDIADEEQAYTISAFQAR